MQKTQIFRLVFVLAALSLALAACELRTTTPTPEKGSGTQTAAVAPAATLTPEDTASPAPATATPTLGVGISKEFNPLTGLPVDAALLDRRPVAVKITNYPRSARPQWGLSRADVVYEYYHNNDLTRFHAIFYGQDAELAGPIRSGRLMDVYLAREYGSELVFASADYRILDALRSNLPAWRLLYQLEGGCPPDPVCRYEPATTNYLLADTATLGDYAVAGGGDNLRQSLESWIFSQPPPIGGEDVARIDIWYSNSAYAYWEYDPSLGRYLRYQDAQDDIGGRGQEYQQMSDRLTGEAVSASNVVVLYLAHSHFYYRPATSLSPAVEIVDIDYEGEGQAYAFRDGQAYELTWRRTGDGRLQLLNADGSPYQFKPGNTWFQVVNDDSQLEIEEGRWYFEFIFRRP